MNPDIFKAYDIRGLYPSELDKEVAFKIGRGLGRFFGKGRNLKMLIARDGRTGSPELHKALARGLKTGGLKLKLVDIGLTTTPMFYVLVQLLKATGGVIVTASHSPREYNGFKVVGRDAKMIPGKEVLKIINREL